jgi:uncharacterized protein (DUF2267 family)
MTSQTDAGLFDAGVREARDWIADVARETGLDEHGALTALRVVLRALRDETTARQNSHFAAEMPTLIRGLYFEGWDPGRPRIVDHDRAEFLRRVRAYVGNDDPSFDVARVTVGVFRVLERRMPGPMARIAHMLPRELRALWTPSIAEQTAERRQRLAAEERVAKQGLLHAEAGHERGAPMAPHQNRAPGEQHRGGPLPNEM